MNATATDWTTWEGRIAWVLANRGETALGIPMNQSSWSTTAGLARTHVWQIKSGRASSPEAETIERLAWAAQVSFHWLATGRGTPDDADVPPEPDAKPARTYGDLPGWAEAAARALEMVPEHDWAIEGVAEMTAEHPPRPLTPFWVAHEATVFAATDGYGLPAEERARLVKRYLERLGGRRESATVRATRTSDPGGGA